MRVKRKRGGVRSRVQREKGMKVRTRQRDRKSVEMWKGRERGRGSGGKG